MSDGKFKEEADALHEILKKRKQARKIKAKREADDFKASQICKSSGKYRIGQT